MSDVLALYQLQLLELEIIDHTRRIKTINQQIENDEALREVEASYEAAEVERDEAAKRARGHGPGNRRLAG